MKTKLPVALVAGGANNIGAACARVLAKEHFIVLADLIDPAPVANELGAERAIAIQGDVSRYSDCEAWVQKAREYGDLKCLVNTVGISSAGGFVEDLPLEEWDRVLQVNLTGSFYIARAAIPALRRSRFEDRSIVLISSRSGKSGKAGVICLVKCLAYELSEEGIRVNSIAPGPIKSLNPDGRPGATINPELWEKVKEKVPLKRMGTPEDIANACEYLCSERAGFITGHTLDVNGGTLMD